MTVLQRYKRLLVLLSVFISLWHGHLGRASTGWKPVPRSAQAASHRVMAFYYPWYGTSDGPGGAGRTVHWGRIDAANKDIQASTDYPELGAYDSHDPKVIERHCRWAKEAGIDTLIVSWWGHGSFSDRAMGKILDGCRRHGLSACIYYETVPRPQTPQSAAGDIVKVLDKYGEHPAHLKIDGKPVVFVYGRTLQELGLTDWLRAIELVNAKSKKGVAAIGDQFSYGSVRVFDGAHTYNTAGPLREMTVPEVRKWASGTYRSWVQLADRAGKISAITVIPGYDDTKIRTPGLAVKRYGGELYRAQWEEAIKADPHWILITSFNEWHEGSEIEPSSEYARRYLDLTAQYSKRFKAGKRSVRGAAASGQFSEEQKAKLREKLQGLQIGVLPGADSMGFWWLLDLGVGIDILTWEKVAGDGLTPQRSPILLYCAGEHYRRTVNKSADVDDALVRYLKAGGSLIALPALPWPFYYDEDGRAVNRSSQFGLTLRMGWEKPPKDAGLRFFQPKRLLPHVPEEFAFPTSGDLRWRPFLAGEGAKHTSLLRLRGDEKEHLADAAAYAELDGGGKIIYVWFSLLEGPYAEALLYDVFDFLAGRLRR
jgi:glycoprotein endo-alpha-1,2-mannosidase